MKPTTFFLDIDGTLVAHMGHGQHEQCDAGVLPGAKEAVDWMLSQGHTVILTTGRREHLREATVLQLKKIGICYDQLVMGLPPGERIVINDAKPDGTITSRAICHTRNTTEWTKSLDLSSRPFDQELRKAD